MASGVLLGYFRILKPYDIQGRIFLKSINQDQDLPEYGVEWKLYGSDICFVEE